MTRADALLLRYGTLGGLIGYEEDMQRDLHVEVRSRRKVSAQPINLPPRVTLNYTPQTVVPASQARQTRANLLPPPSPEPYVLRPIDACCYFDQGREYSQLATDEEIALTPSRPVTPGHSPTETFAAPLEPLSVMTEL